MADPNEADINVILTSVKNDPKWPDDVKFELQSALGSNQELSFKNNGKPGFKLKFKIVDDQNTGYLFPDDETKAMWVRTVTSIDDDCPKTEMYWNQFQATGVDGHNKTLKVRNLNDRIQTFKFTLLFTKTPKQNGPCIKYDPIGQNQNGDQEISFPDH